MYNFVIENVSNKYEYAELIKIFLSPDDFAMYTEAEFAELSEKDRNSIEAIHFNSHHFDDKNEIKRELYKFLSKETGYTAPWGILTGVRPVKLTGEIFDCLGNEQAVRDELKNTYLLSEEKINLLIETYNYQQKVCGKASHNSVGIYIGIPFCPTRCLYCSFTSNQVSDDEIARYIEALEKEIRYVGRRMKETGLYAETIYIGGGTPTTLTSKQLDNLLDVVEESFDMTDLREFTVEAGRPDTITTEKLNTIKKHNIERISINPQSMKPETLKLIGRSHSADDILSAFAAADNSNISIINTDLITGLPEELPSDFKNTLDTVISLKPKNITVHTLAVKRASRLIEQDKDYHYRQGEIVGQMLEISRDTLRENGYVPYYLYRQKHMAGSFENVGYCKNDTPCIYNIRIMEEKQTIIALGAGGISKMYYPEENRLERVPNVSNYEIYISRLEEMLNRKEEKIFMEVGRHVN